MKPRFDARFFLVIALFWVPTAAFASSEGEELDPIHHQVDAFYLDFAPFGKVELPRIFVVRRADGSLGLDLFRSTHSAIEHGYVVQPDAYGAPEDSATDEHSVDENAVDAAADQHAVADENAAASGSAEAESHTSYLDAVIAPAEGHVIIDMSITKHLAFAWLGMLIVGFIFIRLARMYGRGVGREEAPKGIFQNLFETMVVFVRDDIARPNLGEKTEKFLPYLLTAFFFILGCNLLGLVPYGATATSNLMVTGVLATFTFLITQFGASKDHWNHIFRPPGVPVILRVILVPIEILGLFTKPFALAVRLFANMTAGHLVILSLIGLIFSFGQMFGAGAGYGVAPVSLAFALFIYMLELLVSFIQAYVFTMLSALFIGMAVAEHDHHHDDAHAAHPALAAAGLPGEPLDVTVPESVAIPQAR